MKKIGLIINPIAGMGGRVGLKGTDGLDILEKAIQLGAKPISATRTALTVNYVQQKGVDVDWVCCAGEMGATALKDLTCIYQIIATNTDNSPSISDTKQAAQKMVALGVDLIVFAGGDGTARNIFDAIGETPKIIGIPTGVKIHSPVFAQSPIKAGELIVQYLNRQISNFQLTEVIDLDEQEIRNDRVNTQLYGYLNSPVAPRFLQNKKSGSPGSEKAIQKRIAKQVISEMEEDVQYIIGPGSTSAVIMECLDLKNTLLGVDLISNKKRIDNDLNEQALLKYTHQSKTKLIITPTGVQGYLLGRGNQQLSPAILNQIGLKNLIIIATINKLSSIPSNTLLVDTGDLSLDQRLSGYRQIITDEFSTIIYKIGH